MKPRGEELSARGNKSLELSAVGAPEYPRPGLHGRSLSNHCSPSPNGLSYTSLTLVTGRLQLWWASRVDARQMGVLCSLLNG